MNTLEVLDRLRRHFAPPQFGHIVEFERIDFLAVGCWRSNRYDVTGVEVKVSRSDWRRELAKAGKNDVQRTLCDFWTIAAPAGLIDPAEVPAPWGLLAVDERGCRTAKRPGRLRPRWDGIGSPYHPTPEYLARYTFAMAARRWAYSDADRRALDRLAIDPEERRRALDAAAVATGRLTSREREANGEYAREQREHLRAWKAHVGHLEARQRGDGCEWCAVYRDDDEFAAMLARLDARRR